MTPRFRSILACLALFALTSCAFGNRVMLMKEFEPSLPAQHAQSLQGKTICIAEFTDVTNVEDAWTKSEAQDAPDGFKYREMTSAEEASWDKELAERQAALPKLELVTVGWMRNGFGMHTADVESITQPAKWLAQALALELQAQGATVVGPEGRASADLAVDAEIKFLKVDIYLSNWSDLVVEFNLQPRSGPGQKKVWHTSGKQTAWSSSAYEFYRAIRRAQQKMNWLIVPEIERIAGS